LALSLNWTEPTEALLQNLLQVGGHVGLMESYLVFMCFMYLFMYFLVSCMHAALKTLCVQLSQVFYLSSPVQGWEQALSLADESMIDICTQTQKHPIK